MASHENILKIVMNLLGDVATWYKSLVVRAFSADHTRDSSNFHGA